MAVRCHGRSGWRFFSSQASAEASRGFRQRFESSRYGRDPAEASLAAPLRACADSKSLARGRRIHAALSLDCGFRIPANVYLANQLVHMYGKCGCVEEARSVFDSLPHPTPAISWNIIISAYSQNGYHEETLVLYQCMLKEGIAPDKFTFLPVLSSSASLKALHVGKQVHQRIRSAGLTDLVLQTALLNMYAKCSDVEDAQVVFDGICIRDMIAWSAIISAYAQNGYIKEALELCKQMEMDGFKPRKSILLGLISMCTDLHSLVFGKAVHNYITNSGLDSDHTVMTALLNMYGKCGCLKEAQTIFDGMRRRDVISWNAMLTVYAQSGHLAKESLSLLREMDLEGVKPDRVTFLCLLNACTSPEFLNEGRAIHHYIAAEDRALTDTTVKTALLTMYSKCGSLEDAWSVFNEDQQRDVVSWSAMLAACARKGHADEALELFRVMNSNGMKPDKVTFLSLLSACTSLASLEKGRAIHECMLSSGSEFDATVKISLINMYGKCGSINEARSVFDGMHGQGMICWNAMLAAYVWNGCTKEAMEFFRQMGSEGVKPDIVTFLCVINACSHAGLQDEGWRWFVSMHSDYEITPSPEHYGCMLDLLSRAGFLKEAEDAARNIPVETDSVSWKTLLGSSHMQCKVDLKTQMQNGIQSATGISKGEK